MRRDFGTVLIVVFVIAFSVNPRSEGNDYELTPRHGVPARVFLKGCHKLASPAKETRVKPPACWDQLANNSSAGLLARMNELWNKTPVSTKRAPSAKSTTFWRSSNLFFHRLYV